MNKPKRMKKISQFILAITLTISTLISCWTFIKRLALDYNSEGKFFDENTNVVYYEQAVLIYGIISFVLLVFLIIVGWNYKKILKN